ncbi:hypothetical protein Taro_046310 [Colocasia esculenta]|uniref:Uncharacterized protein n=1 Tax=Colocasia esculenta TaxID=4460 RepID=A0A843X5F1_COLES|nr:hypothetical protein [Colocasia esculenta]
MAYGMIYNNGFICILPISWASGGCDKLLNLSSATFCVVHLKFILMDRKCANASTLFVTAHAYGLRPLALPFPSSFFFNRYRCLNDFWNKLQIMPACMVFFFLDFYTNTELLLKFTASFRYHTFLRGPLDGSTPIQSD